MWFKNRRAKWRKQRLEAAAAGARSSGTERLTDVEWTEEADWEEDFPSKSSPVGIRAKRIGANERKRESTAEGLGSPGLVIATDSEPCSDDSDEEEGVPVEGTTPGNHDACRKSNEDNQRHTAFADYLPRLPSLPPQLHSYEER